MWRLLFSLVVMGDNDGKHPAMLEQLPECEPFLPRNLEQFAVQRQCPAPQLCGVSSALITPMSDWTYQLVFTGYWVVSRTEQEQRMANGDACFGGAEVGELEEFMAEGSGWGSMIAVSPEHMACLAVRSLKEAGLRGVVLSGWAELSVENMSGQPDSKELLAFAKESVLFVKTAPHEWLFPQCSAIVHHGGSGTTAAALRSGRPSIVTPCGFDQFQNALMVAESGAGVGLPQIRKVTCRVLAAALTKVLADGALIARAQALGEQLRGEDGVGAAVRVLDTFFAEEMATGVWQAKATRTQHAFQELARPSISTRIGHFCSALCGGSAPSSN
ncbi:unnamed protein product [Polarella glacialis]|nr:unnamed protein product [Polarella glacialis]